MAAETTNPARQTIGNYALLEKIAEGGMGAIYRAQNRDSGQVVAIKVMPTHLANNPVLVRRFEQEFRAASKLDHPNVVRAIDYGEDNGMPFLVMEFVDGESLGARIERTGRMQVQEAVKLICDVAQGLHRAHKLGMIHRDVKPDNILVTQDGKAKLADLGLVKEVDADLNLTKTGRGLGTPHFMAPEQFRNAKNADVRCDVYSLGATLYMLVTGELPFRSNGPLDAWMKKINNELIEPRALVPDLPERVNWAILRSMAVHPDQRPSSCREFVEDLIGQSTRRLPSTDSSAPMHEFWYLVYKDDEGATHTVKGTTSAIRRSLKDGLLGDAANVRASRTKTGPWESLRAFPEFRDLLTPAGVGVAPSPVPASAFPSRDSGPITARASGQVARETVSGTRQPTPKPTPAPSRPSPVPHIDIGSATGNDDSFPEWTKWVLLALIALASAALAFFLLPLL